MKVFKNKTLATYLKGLIVLWVCLFGFSFEAGATHIVGGDLTYRKIGNNRFRITLNLRRDCSKNPATGKDENEPFDSRAVITAFEEQANGNFTFLQEHTIDKEPAQDVDGKIESNCGFEGTQICYQQTKYEVDVTLMPNPNGGYTFTYQRCCRNGSINNVANPLETGATFSVYIPKEAWSTQGNSSPYFVEWPAVYICGGTDLSYLNTAVDPDGDSLVYKLCTPKIGFTKEKPRHASNNKNTPPPYLDLTWQPPYNLNNLMGGTPLKIDAKTGLMTAKPLAIEGQYVIGVCVEEWRNGVKIGEVRRDFQYNVRICTTPPTAIYEAPSKVCDVKTVNFTNNSLASNSYSWNFNYPSVDPQFQSTEKNPTFTFPENGTYDVRLIVVRGSDKCSDTITKPIRLTDIPYNADFTYDILSCNPDGSSTVTLTDNSTTLDTGQFSTAWNWTLIQNNVSQTSTTNPGVFTVNPENFTVNLKVGASNGCNGDTIKPVEFNDKILESDFRVELDSCSNIGELKIKLIDLTQSLNDNFVVTESNWTITTASGNVINLSGDTSLLTISRQAFDVRLDVNTNKQCREVTQKSFGTGDFIPTVDFDITLPLCDQNNLPVIRLTEKSNDNTTYSNVEEYQWTIGNQVFTGQTIDYTAGLKDTLYPKLTLRFANTCLVSLDSIVDVNVRRPKVDYDYTPVECPTDTEVKLEFGYNNSGENGFTNNGVNWILGTASSSGNYNGNTIEIIIPKDSIVLGSVFANFENNCKDSISFQFLPGPFATLHLVTENDTLCPNEIKTIFTNKNPNFTYIWTPNTGIIETDTSFNLKATVDQVYEVEVVDALCRVKGNIAIDVRESIDLDVLGVENTCDGTVNLQVVGGVGEGIYEWSTNPDFTTIIDVDDSLKTTFNTVSQSYYVRFIGKVCSANPGTKTITNQTPRFEIFSPFPICIGDTIKTRNVLNGEPTHLININWTPDPHLVSGGNTLTPDVGTIGNDDQDFTLYFTATNQFNCPYNDSVEFVIRENPVADFDFNVTSCDSFKVCFDYIESNNDPHFGFFVWNFGDQSQEILNVENICHFYSDSGSYKVTLRNISERCPFKNIEKEIRLGLQPPVFDNPNAEDCINTDFTLQLPAGIQPPFQWTDINGNLISNEANPEVQITSDTSFLLNVTDELGCRYNDTFNIKAFVIDFDLTTPDTVCDKGIYQINTTVTGGFEYTYQWGPSNAVVSGGTSGNPLVDVAKASSYIVTVTYPGLGCTTVGTVAFNQFQFDYSLVPPDLFCNGATAEASIDVDGTPNYIYQWSPSNLILSGDNAPNMTFSVVDGSEIKVLVKHPTLNCELRDSFTVDAVTLQVELDAEPELTVPKGKVVDVFVVDPETGSTYVWSNNFTGTTQKVTINSDTTFFVTVTDGNGCSGEDEVSLKIRLPVCEEDVFIPTAFSPNGDASNNVLFVRSNYISDMELVIYNRWGQEVFTTKDINIGWDGKFKGAELSPDTYAYWLRAKCTDGEDIVKQGSISLLR